jgi:sulfur carrier protein
MKVILNGREEFLPGSVSLAQLITDKGLRPEVVVVEYNRTILKKEDWASTIVNEGDNIELLRFLGGGGTNA